MSIRDTYKEVADAIREVEGSSGEIPRADFDDRIRNLSTGFMGLTYYDPEKTASGCTSKYLINGDVEITIPSQATADATFNLFSRTASRLRLQKGKTYIISGCPAGGGASGSGKWRMFLNTTKNSASYVLGIDYGEGFTVTINDDNYGSGLFGIAITIWKNCVLTEPLIFKVKIEEVTINERARLYQPLRQEEDYEESDGWTDDI